MQSFIQLESQIITDKNISPLELRLYMYLLDVGRKGRGYSVCGHRWLGEILGVHSQTIAKCLKNLTKFGYVSIERQGLNKNDKIRCRKTIKPQSRSESRDANKKSRKDIAPYNNLNRSKKDIERDRPDAIVDKSKKRLSHDSNTPQKKVDEQRTEEVQTTLQTHMRPKLYDLWFRSMEVIESEENLTEIRLNTGDIGFDHISNHYLNDLKTIIGTEIKLTI